VGKAFYQTRLILSKQAYKLVQQAISKLICVTKHSHKRIWLLKVDLDEGKEIQLGQAICYVEFVIRYDHLVKL
jgi:hypothetical protein